MDLTGGMQMIEQPVSGGHYAQAVVAAGSLTGPTAVATGTDAQAYEHLAIRWRPWNA